MRHRADHGRHERRPRVPLRSYLLAALALCAAVLSAAGLAETFTARAAVTAPAVAAADRGAEFAPASETMVNLDKTALIASQERARAQERAAFAAAHTYTVRSGQSMSDVARLRCAGKAADWTGIYAASRALGWTARNANVLATGQHLWIACAYDARQLRFAPAPPPPPVRAVVAVAAARTGHGYSAAVTNRAPAPAYSGASAATYHGSGSMQQCIISRESGGNSQVMNSSAHYGLYQFSASTWAAHGGSPASFGHASVAEQNAVYYATVAADGYSDWAPYDGC
jgi:hypothetical protein